MRLPCGTLELTPPNLILFDQLASAALSNEWPSVIPFPVEVPAGGDAVADVAIKVHTPRIGDHIVAVGVARYPDGRVVGEAHTQAKFTNRTWMDGHVHADVLCASFVRNAGDFPAPGPAAEQMHRRSGPEGLALGAMVLRWMRDGTSACDFFRNVSTQRLVGNLEGRVRGRRLFVDPALQAAVASRLQEAPDVQPEDDTELARAIAALQAHFSGS